jgi:hypothetical protein
MEIEVKNIGRTRFMAQLVREKLIIKDQEGFEYYTLRNTELCDSSDFSKRYKLNRFLYSNDELSIKPRIPTKGGLIFILPNGSANSGYDLGVIDDTIVGKKDL